MLLEVTNEFIVMDGIDDPGGSFNNSCFKCKALLDDIKTTVQCMLCKNDFHGRCENVDFRGFHLRRASWRCKQCFDTHGDGKSDGPNRPRKRSRIDDLEDQSVVDGINYTLSILVKTTNDLNEKVDKLLEENKMLKMEIASLRSQPTVNDSQNQTVPNISYATVASNPPNNTKVLVVKQKGSQKDIKQIKKDLQEKIKPAELGLGVSMGRPTKNGGLIISCGNEKEISTVRSEIQKKLGENYEVDQPKKHDHRIKVVGVHESEYEEDLIMSVIKQNELQENIKDFKLKILRKSNVLNKRFNIIFEVDSSSYNLLINKEIINIGWSRCRVFNDYGIVRCYNCNKYGHLQKDCKNKIMCAKCSGDHDTKQCMDESDNCKCVNCIDSNDKFKMNLDINHPAWDYANCETYKRIEKIRRNKFLQ